MKNRLRNKIAIIISICLVTIVSWMFTPQPEAQAVNNPELLPAEVTPVVDLANYIPELQQESLSKTLDKFETETGWKLRVLTQYEKSPGRAVINFWDLDDQSILLVADGKGGNLLAFSVGDDVYDLLPRTFWIELQTRFGNMYYVRDNGENNAIVAAMDTVRTCLADGGCLVVPGLPREQWILTLITSTVGGVIFGFAALPRKEGQVFAWQWVLIISPLWGILFLAFGMGPVLTRTTDWLPISRNIMGFVLGALVAYLSPFFNSQNTSET